MSSYRMVALGTLIHQAKNIRCGSGEYPVLSMTMRDGLVFQDEKFKKVIASADRSNYKVVHRNQLVIGFPIDEGVLATQRIVDAGIVSPAYGIWDIDQRKILPEFLEYVLRCERALSYYKAKLRGSTARRRSLPTQTLLEFDIPLPDIQEQEFILEVLRKAKKIIANRTEERESLNTLIKARFVEMFGDPVTNEKRWEQKSLGEITTKIGSGATPKGGKSAYQEEGVTLIRSMNVHNGLFEYKELAHISDEQAAELDNVTIEENDVLLNLTGASVARSCVVPSKILPARVNQHVCIIRCKECIIPEFLNKLLIDDNYQDLLWSIAEAGATREAITKRQVEDLQIIIPPVGLQKEFMSFCNQVEKSKF